MTMTKLLTNRSLESLLIRFLLKTFNFDFDLNVK